MAVSLKVKSGLLITAIEISKYPKDSASKKLLLATEIAPEIESITKTLFPIKILYLKLELESASIMLIGPINVPLGEFSAMVKVSGNKIGFSLISITLIP